MARIHVLPPLPRTPFIPPSPARSRNPNATTQHKRSKSQLYHPHTSTLPLTQQNKLPPTTLLHPKPRLSHPHIPQVKRRHFLPLNHTHTHRKSELPSPVLPFDPTHLPPHRP